MRCALAVLGLSLIATPGRSEVMVRVSGSQIELTATAAPLADVLDRLARQTGMKVVYEGPAPRQLVTLALHARSPAETVLAVLEGQGLNFAMVGDPGGSGVSTLVLAGASEASSSAAPTSSKFPAANRFSGRIRQGRRFTPPPGSSPDAVEPAPEDEEEAEQVNEAPFPSAPSGMEATDPDAAPTAPDPTASPEAEQPGLPPGARGGPVFPKQEFPVSPFAPQPQPYPSPAQGRPIVPGGPPPDQASVPASIPPP
jgi:hypothetical protein